MISNAVNGLGVDETQIETFTYTIEDGDNDRATADLLITVSGINDDVFELSTGAASPTGPGEGSQISISKLLTFSDLYLSDFAENAEEEWSITVDWGDGNRSVLTKNDLVSTFDGDSVTLSLTRPGNSQLEPNQSNSTINGRLILIVPKL